MTRSREVPATEGTSLKRGGPDGAATRLGQEANLPGVVPGRKSQPPSRAALTWTVAEGIHRRCCEEGLCIGAFEHLSATAVAVELLAPAVRSSLADPSRGRPASAA